MNESELTRAKELREKLIKLADEITDVGEMYLRNAPDTDRSDKFIALNDELHDYMMPKIRENADIGRAVLCAAVSGLLAVDADNLTSLITIADLMGPVNLGELLDNLASKKRA